MVPWGHSNMEMAVANTVLLGTSTAQLFHIIDRCCNLNKGHLTSLTTHLWILYQSVLKNKLTEPIRLIISKMENG